MLKKGISLVLVLTLMLSSAPTVFAQGAAGYETDIGQEVIVYNMQTVASKIDFAEGAKYSISVPSTLGDESQPSAWQWLESILADVPLEWTNASGDMRVYNMSAIEGLTVNNAKNITGVEYIFGTYYISYYTVDDEYVMLEYYSDGRENKNVRANAGEDADGVSVDKEAIHFDSATQTVTRTVGVATSAQESRGVTRVDFPSPRECGFIDTGTNGTLVKTQSVYISAMNANTTARVMKYETEYKRERSEWGTWGGKYIGWQCSPCSWMGRCATCQFSVCRRSGFEFCEWCLYACRAIEFTEISGLHSGGRKIW